MLSHNNWEEQIKKYEPKKQRFTIKKLSVGVASVLLGVTFAAGTASADTTTANADSASGDGSAEQTDHNLTVNSASTSTLKSATAASQSNSASAAVQNPAGDIKAQAANDYEAAVSAAVANASSNVASDAAQNNSASSAQSSSAADSSAQASAVKSTATQAFDVKSVAANNFNYASVFASLAAMQQANNDNAAQPSAASSTANDEYSNYKTVTDWNGLQNAISSGAQGVNIKGTINPGWFGTGDLNINGSFTIHGVEGAVLNLGQNKIINNGQLTLADVTINGSVMGNGTVNIKGTVNSNADASNSAITGRSTDWLKQNLDSAIGTTNGGGGYGFRWTGDNNIGWSTSDWYTANFTASKVNVEQGATLNINRSVTGDGIDLINGASTFVDDGTTFGSTKQINENGTLNVGINSKLNINLKNASGLTRANEQAVSFDNAVSGVRAIDNGHILTGDSAQVTINAGHGRAINFDEPFGGKSSVEPGSNPMTAWYNNRNASRNKNYAQTSNNTIVLGDSTQLSITGRDGILMGNRSKFVTGNHSVVKIDSVGNGAGLLGDAFSTVIVSPQSQLLLTSNGKDKSGHFSGGNFIGLGENGQFRVEHDATFRYRLINRGGSGNVYDDNMNIISINPDSHPEVYVGNNATFDGQSDYTDFYGEIFAFPLGSTSTVFQIDGAKYVNWEKNALVTGHDHQGNLYYSMGNGLIDATGQSYYVFKWNNGNLNDGNITFKDGSAEQIESSIKGFINSSDKWWSGITGLATKYSQSGNLSEWPGHVVSGSDIQGVNTIDHKTGTPANKFSASASNDTGFDPLNSQRLVLVASTIPTQEDTTKQEVEDYNVKIIYDENLQPGQVQLVQQGVKGLKRTTTTTYYNVDPSTGKKTLDTSKGDNGVSTKTTVLNEAQDEIIHIGKQKATINYLKQDGSQDPTPITDNGQAIVGTVEGNPVKTDAAGNVEFDADGNATANTIDYTNYSNDLSNAKKNAEGYKYNEADDEWEQAVKNSTNKYNVSGLTKAAIQEAAEKAGLNNAVTLNNEGPVYNVTLKKAEKGSVKVVYHDDTTNTTISGYGYDSKEQDAGTKVDYTTQPSIDALIDEGYVYVSTDKNVPTEIPANENVTVTVHMKHGLEDVNKNNPHGQQVEATVTRNVNYTVNGQPSSQLSSKSENVQFSATGHWDKVLHQLVDVVNGNIVVENGQVKQGSLTWTPESGTLNGYDAPVLKGYHVDSVSATSNGQDVTTANVNGDGSVNSISVNHNDKNIMVNVNLVNNGKETRNEQTKTISMTVHYEGAGENTPKDNVQNVTFHYTGDVWDTTTNTELSKGHWEVNGTEGSSYKFNDVATPDVKGYTPDKENVQGVTVDPNSQNQRFVVTYKQADASLNVVYYDETTKTTLKTDTVNGKMGNAIDYSTADSIANYESQGYVLVNDGFTGQAGNDFSDANNGKTYRVTLKHGTKPVNPENPTDKYTKNDLQKQATRTINYVDNNGNKIADSVTSTVVFTGSGVVDTVTGNLVNLNADGSIKDQNGQLTWTYSVDGSAAQKGTSYTFGATTARPTITYNGSDYNFTSVNPGNYNAGSGAVSSYLVNNQDPQNLTVDVVYNKQATYHAGKTDTKEVTRTINYLDGKTGEKIPANLIAGNPVKQTANMHRTEIVDQDGNVKGYGTISQDGKSYTINNNWIIDGNWDAVTSPDLTGNGYKAPRFENGSSAATVNAVTVNADTKDTSVNVYYDHNLIPVGPDTPDKHGVNPDEVEKNVKETVHYVGAGEKTPADNVQNSKWTRTLTYDEVTKQLVPGGQYDTDWKIADGQPSTYSQVDTPVIEGYYADQANVPATAVTQNDIEKTVTYKQIGKIIPVGPDGNPIPGQPTPQFPNDPTDPTKVTPGTKPDVPGYHPQTGKPGEPVNPVPGNPGEDVKVPYVKDQGAVTVVFHDDTTNTTIPGYGYNSGNLDAGTKVDYTTTQSIKDLEAKGYVYVNTDGEIPAEIPANNTVNVTVHMKHGTRPVTPKNPGAGYDKTDLEKEVTRTIYFVNTQDGKQVADSVKQTVNFTATGTVDMVTGKLVTVVDGKITGEGKLTWTPAQDVKAVTSPSVDGMHVSYVSRDADGNNVKGVSLTHEDNSYDVIVNYVNNGTKTENGKNIPASQTIKFVDENGNTLRENNVQNSEFTRTPDVVDATTGKTITEGSWNETSHQLLEH